MKISKDSGHMLDICEQYCEGKLNLEEATDKMQRVLPLGEEYIHNLFRGFERDNVKALHDLKQ